MQARAQQMQALRDKGHILQSIADHFGISKQRVFQVLGPTGYVSHYLRLNDRDWLVAQKQAGRSDADIAGELGCNQVTVWNARQRLGLSHLGLNTTWNPLNLDEALRQWAREHGRILTAEALRETGGTDLLAPIVEFGGYVYWRSRLGQRLDPDSPVSKGRYFEWQAFSALLAHGHTAQVMPWRHSFDILVDGCLRIDVKGSNRNARDFFAFSLRGDNGHDIDCDLLMLACQDGEITWFIIPETAIGKRRGITIWPPSYGRWIDYCEAWKLLEQP